ncbi:arabinose phosphate phosphatase [Kaistia sp. 32K]|uniref:inositol monophosphatase family protein n=1 Tax=Kaistia sp. 32K TaxID=2795690 RepID=UPI001914E900|nr:inositol monophosphatase [Kaistia sp. 32K]BCP55735.1 arabinose phosphate phosphatase [Kaistia sp. 32K]
MRDELIGLAQAAGRIGLAYFRGAGTEKGVEEKGHLDLVTRADREVEAFLVSELQRLYPEDGICGEEGATHRPDARRQWVIDPIDGTFNFVRGMDPWAVSIGLYEDGAPAFGVIHAPARQETLSGGRGVDVLLNGEIVPPLPALDRKRGVIAVGFSTDTPVDKELAALRYILDDLKMTYRHCGSTTAAFLMLAAGQVDACLGFGVRSWDVMAALPVVEQLGGVSTIDWQASDILQKFDYLAGSAETVALARPILDWRPA